MKNEEKYNHGFKAPDDYFESFEERLFNKLKETELPKKHGFDVPDGYFENLEERILQNVAQEKTVKVIRLFKRKTFIYAISVAACAALVFSIYTGNTGKVEPLRIADIEAYIDGDAMDLDSYDIAQLLSEYEIDNLTLENEIFSQESLEDYLLDHLDDTTLLIE
jgi:hypothetical protein